MDETAHLTVNVTWPTHDHVTQFLGIVVASLAGRAMFARKVNDRVQYIFYSISLKPSSFVYCKSIKLRNVG